MQRTGFNQSVIDKLNYYVYSLVDPRATGYFTSERDMGTVCSNIPCAP